jgi:hypothetical protein
MVPFPYRTNINRYVLSNSQDEKGSVGGGGDNHHRDPPKKLREKRKEESVAHSLYHWNVEISVMRQMDALKAGT